MRYDPLPADNHDRMTEPNTENNRLELLYLWIEDYKNIHHQGFNFSPDHRFIFEPVFEEVEENGQTVQRVKSGTLKELPIEKQPLKDFFQPDESVLNHWKNRDEKLGTICNITAIVGKNGAGKSNLLEFMKEFLFSKSDFSKQYISIYYDFIEKTLLIRKNVQYEIIYMINGKIDTIKNFTIPDLVFYSNFSPSLMDPFLPEYRIGRGYFTENHFVPKLDISTGNFLINEFSQNTFDYMIYENNKLFHYFLAEPAANSVFEKINEKIQFIKINFTKPIIRDIHLDIVKMKFSLPESPIIDFFQFNLSKQIVLLNKNFEFVFYLNFLKLFFVRYSVINQSILTDKFFHIFKDFKKPSADLANSSEEQRYVDILTTSEKNKIISSIKEYVKEISDLYAEKVKIQSFKGAVSSLFNAFQQMNQLYPLQVDTLNSIDFSFITVPIAEKELVKKFFESYKELSHSVPFLFFSFEPNMSSGEKAYLFLSSRFYSTVDQSFLSGGKIDPSVPNLLLLIDEGEVGFHPEWQRKYLKYLIDFFPQIYPGKNIQIILTTHSPFLVSDLPKENILFLEQGEEKDGNFSDGVSKKGKCLVADGLAKKSTFGANIHTLFADSFFLDGGLMGEFAKGKIGELINLLQKDEELGSEEKHKIKTMIEIIGEPLIQRKLRQMYYAKIDYDPIRENEELKKEIERLKREQK